MRVFNNKGARINFLTSQPMRIYSSLWNEEDLATQGGRAKTDRLFQELNCADGFNPFLSNTSAPPSDYELALTDTAANSPITRCNLTRIDIKSKPIQEN
ncbi:hypothetical protein LIER_31409 [Lithospermum erythrorhizon]|uniref:Uncharacterized protein n=1 Tax=Lithospermum erythrorhizon TaxID=34254 RepID=A0AAV3RW80_LITER